MIESLYEANKHWQKHCALFCPVLSFTCTVFYQYQHGYKAVGNILCSVNLLMSDGIVGQSSLCMYELRLSHDGPSTSSWCHSGGSCKHLLSYNTRITCTKLQCTLHWKTSRSTSCLVTIYFIPSPLFYVDSVLGFCVTFLLRSILCDSLCIFRSSSVILTDDIRIIIMCKQMLWCFPSSSILLMIW